MKRIVAGFVLAFSCLSLIGIPMMSRTTAASAKAASVEVTQDKEETYTGTLVNMNGRMATIGFSLYLKDFTPDEEATRYLSILAEGDQDDLLKVIRKNDLGSFVPTGSTRRVIHVARKTVLPDGRTRIAVA